MQQYQLVSKQVTQVENDSKIRAVTESHKLNITQCELNQAKNHICNINQESIIEDSSINTAPFASLETEEEETIKPLNTFMYTNEIRVENKLLKLVSDMNATNDAFKRIVEWAKDAFSTGYQFNQKLPAIEVKLCKWKTIATSSLSGHSTSQSYYLIP